MSPKMMNIKFTESGLRVRQVQTTKYLSTEHWQEKEEATTASSLLIQEPEQP